MRRSTVGLLSGSVLAVAAWCAAVATPALGHPPESPVPLANPDGVTTVKASHETSRRVFRLRTRDDRDLVQVQLRAKLDGRIQVSILDPDGHSRAELEGGGATSLEVDTGELRLVDSPHGEQEAPRGNWRVEVRLEGVTGSYELRYVGFTPVEGFPLPE
jgi:hypothetical protein